jgi:diguanylate cyclase (GGDEF)-like protein
VKRGDTVTNNNIHKLEAVEQRNLIDEFIQSNKLEEALEVTIIVYEESLANNRYDMICYCLYYFGLIEEKKMDFQKALVYYKKSTVLSRKYTIQDCLVRVLKKRGIIYWLNGQFGLAISKYLEALNVVNQDASLEKLKPGLINNVGLLHLELEQYDRAIQYFFDTIELAKKMKLDLELTVAYSNLANIYIKSKSILKAKYYNRLSLQQSEKINDQIGIGISKSFEAMILNLEKGSWLEIKRLFEEGLGIIEKCDDDIDLAELLLNYGEVALQKKEYAMGESILNRILKLTEVTKFELLEQKALSLLEEIYSEQKLYSKAYETAKRQLEINKTATEHLKKKTFQSIEKNNAEVDDTKIDELQKSIRTLKLLSEIGQKITACTHIKEIYQVLVEDAKEIFACDAYGIGVKNKDNLTIDYKYYDMDTLIEAEISIFDEDYLMAQCIKMGEDIIVYNTKSEDIIMENKSYSERLKQVLLHAHNHTIIFCPIKFEGITIGAITIQSEEQGKLTYVDLESLRVLAAYISIAFSNLNRADELLIAKIKMEEASMLDGLTGVYNRHALGQYIGKEFIGMLESKLPALALMIDIDYFKQYNDNYGHVMGDRCLKRVCGALRNGLSSYQHKLFRYGGDEFFVIIEKCDDVQAKDVLDKLIKDIEFLRIEHLHSKVAKYVTLTIGGALIDYQIRDYTYVFTSADEALYQAKENGRNQYVLSKIKEK